MAGQQRTTLKGRVTAADVPATGVFVINKTTGTEVKTDARGAFSILAKKGDKLVVYSTKTEEKQFYVSEESFKNMPWVLAVVPVAVEIEEVVVADTIHVNDPTSGRMAVYTPAERRANIGSKVTTHNMGDYAGGGVSVGVDAVLNGGEKRKQLRRELKTEQLQKNIEGISAIYTNEQITSYYGIPAKQVPAFLYYAAEDVLVSDALKDKNAELVKMQLPVVAMEYRELQLEDEPLEPVTKPGE